MDDDELTALVLNIPRRSGPGPKRLSPPPQVMYERDLDAGDLLRLEEGERPTTQLPQAPLAQIKYKHHMAARLIAEGLDFVQVSASTGYATSTLATLRNDPAFAELVNYYKEQNSQIYTEAHQKLALLGMTAVEQVQERLDDPEQAAGMGTKTLIDIAEFALERSVAPARGKATLQLPTEAGQGLTVNLNFSDPPKPSQVVDVEILKEEPEEPFDVDP